MLLILVTSQRYGLLTVDSFSQLAGQSQSIGRSVRAHHVNKLEFACGLARSLRQLREQRQHAVVALATIEHLGAADVAAAYALLARGEQHSQCRLLLKGKDYVQILPCGVCTSIFCLLL